MNTDIDWREELDSSFGAGPDHPPTDYLAPGRAALRKRRTAMGAAALATLVVVGGIGWAVAPDRDDPRSSEVASDPSPSVSAMPSEAPSRVAPITRRREDVRIAEPGEVQDLGTGGTIPVTVLGSGELVREKGWEVEALHVLRETPRRRAWGVSAVPSAGGGATWMILDWSRGSSGSISDPAGKRFAVFEDWMDTIWAEQQAAQPPPPASRTVDGQLALAPGVETLERLDHPTEAAAYGPVDEMVAAKLRLTDGTVVFSLIGPDGETTVDPAALEAPTMDAFLRHLQGQADNGEGLR